MGPASTSRALSRKPSGGADFFELQAAQNFQKRMKEEENESEKF
jgi:hypothetical protein